MLMTAGSSRTEKLEPDAGPPAAARRLEVAVVEDEEFMRNLVAKILATRGHKARPFADAASALESICHQPVDVVICDLNLEGLAGDAFTASLRRRLGAAAPPVVMMSGADDEERVGRALDAGARHYVKKPFARGEILAIVERASREALAAGPPAAGGRLGPYRLVREIGRGGMGTVFEALRDGATRPVALKVLLSARDLEDHLRFRRELDVLASLDHPGIARLLESGLEGGRAYYTMELVPGRSLAQELATSGALPWPRVAYLGRDLAETLAFLHGRGIVHRDVKPSNVVLAPLARPRLVDFGLARRPRDLSLTSPSQIVGTPLYLPPEILMGDEPSPAGDVFSLAVTLVESLRGDHPAPPAARENIFTLLQYSRDGRLARVAALVPSAPPGLASALEAALGADPGLRPTADALARALGACLP